jgi:hypothetical protein
VTVSSEKRGTVIGVKNNEKKSFEKGGFSEFEKPINSKKTERRT